METRTPIPFENSFARLPGRFYSPEQPTPVAAPSLIRANLALAGQLNIDRDWLTSAEAIDVFAGNRIPEGAEPIATVYAGHQFGGFNPQLGDGRAILLGEVLDARGRRYDIQLKGAGQTPYSRMGDGRSPLGPVLREYIVSEAMAALGIPTTRSLFAVATGEQVFRDGVLPGAILTRVARSHIRVGHFQYFYARDDREAVRALADHLIDRDFPEAGIADNPYLALLEHAIGRQAALIAQWQLAGFIHGVMNTDNMLICGETVDYGPCAFMDRYDPDTCFSSIDHGKRYAYKNQPGIAQWNLAWLAQALLPLIDEDEEKAIAIAKAALARFSDQFEHAFEAGLHRKFGMVEISDESRRFTADFLAQMAATGRDFTLAFRHLADMAAVDSAPETRVDYMLGDEFDDLLQQWHSLRGEQGEQVDLRAENPAFIPRNHLVEEAIRSAERDGNLEPFHALVDILARPFDYDPANDRYTRPPRPGEEVKQTFCGT